LIVVECYIDLILVSFLGFKDIRHEENKPAVIEELRRRAEGGIRVVGLVDEDPGSPWPRYFKERFSRVKRTQHGFDVWKGPGGAYLVVLKPLHEAWIYDVARSCGLDVARYDLPRNWERFHSLIHSGRRGSRALRCYMRLLKDLTASNCRALRALKDVLNTLLRSSTPS